MKIKFSNKILILTMIVLGGIFFFPKQSLAYQDIGLRAYDGNEIVEIAIEDNLSSSPLRISKNGTTYAIALVDPSDPDATNILIDTQSGIKALRKIFLCPSNITYEGQNYPIVTIGNQCWFANNLNVGIMIAGTSGQGNNGIIEKYCYNNTTANCDTYGGLYQWNEAMQYTTTEKAQGICPAGWHIPSDAEIYTLENYLATGACSATRTGWGCNPAGQAFLNTPPAGRRMIAGNFGSINLHLNLWSSTGNVASAWRRYLYIGQSTIYRNTYGTGYGFTVRCLKD